MRVQRAQVSEALKAVDRLQALFALVLCVACLATASYILLELNWHKSKPLGNVSTSVTVTNLVDPTGDPVRIKDILDRAKSGPATKTLGSEGTLGIHLEITSPVTLATPILELRLYTADSARFWAWDRNLQKLQEVSVEILDSRSAILVRLPQDIAFTELYGEIRTFARWKPKIYVWANSTSAKIERDFDRVGGALVGAFTLLAAFSLAIGLLNKDLTFLVFAAWLLTSLRVAGLNGGWDLFWLGVQIDSQTLLFAQRASLAIHAFLTLTLYRLVFFTGHEPKGEKLLSHLLLGSFLILLASSPAIQHETFSRFFWPIAGLGLIYILISTGRRFVSAPSRILFWYSLSWVAMAAGLLSEILYQTSASAFVNAGLNAQSGAVIAALMMGLALADRLKTERDARMAAQNSQVKTLKQLKDYFDASPIGLFRVSTSGEILLANNAFWAIVSQNDRARPGKLADAINASEQHLCSILEGANVELEIPSLQAEEQSKWLLVTTKHSNGFIEGQLQDISARKRAESTLQYLVNHDSLTGVGNRRGLDEAFSSLFSRKDSVERCSVANLAIDRFKSVNDLYGFKAGDQLLKEAATRIRNAIRPTDYVARLGDTFILILTGCSAEQSRTLCDRVRKEISTEPFALGAITLQLTASVGVVQLSADATANSAFTAAAHAWADAKALGRNKVVLVGFEEQVVTNRIAELQMVSKLNAKLLDQELTLAMQPIVGFHGKTSEIAFEVLLRKKTCSKNVDSSPGGFLQAAERSGFMSRVDLWVISNSLAWLEKNPIVSNALAFCTINVSGASINDSEFTNDLDTLLRSSSCDLRKVCFEITEGVALNDIAVTRRFIQLVKFYGCKLALDDFGAGYTSFSSLKDIPADFIKIDGSFIKDIASNPSNFAITGTIVSLTHQLGMLSIAEWAETTECVKALESLGVDYGQGFILGGPIPAEEMSSSLSQLLKDRRDLVTS
jgi:diguanylate cyclase (GGDEF)-like protein